MFLIAMISLTMSRISSRADLAVELGELREVDRLDQGAENRRFDLIVIFGAALCDDGAMVRRARVTAAAMTQPVAQTQPSRRERAPARWRA